MKRELIAIAMIILMVFTVFGTVAVTAKPANATPVSNPIYMVTPGLPKVWGKELWNYQFQTSTKGASADINGRKLAATAHVGEIVVAHADGFCEVGVNWYLNPHVDWNKVKDKPVLVTAVVGYTLSGSGSGVAGGDVWLGTFGRHTVIEHKDSKAASYSVNQPFKVAQWTTTLSALATKPGSGQLYVFAGAYANSGIVTGTQSSTQATVYMIGLQLL